MPQGNPKPGEKYLHFKKKAYQIIAVARHSETNEKMVVYQALYGEFGVYVRPYDMFISEVDHSKYPRVEQKYRFMYLEDGKIPVESKALEEQAEVQAVPQDTPEKVQTEDANSLLIRFLDAETFAEKYEIVDRMETRARSLGCDMRKGQPTPGNIEGGLSSIEEKSLGAIVKSGTKPIQGVLEYPEQMNGRKGLWIKDTPGREPEILTGMAATGAQFMMFSTGRGAPQGFPTMPVLKVCGNPNTYERMRYDMDINAGRIIAGEKSIEEVGEEAFCAVLELLSGKQTKNETLGYHSSIDIYTMGPVI